MIKNGWKEKNLHVFLSKKDMKFTCIKKLIKIQLHVKMAKNGSDFSCKHVFCQNGGQNGGILKFFIKKESCAILKKVGNLVVKGKT